MMQHQSGQWISTIISFAIVALVMTIRLRRMRRERPLKLERLWIVPAIYGAVAAVAYWYMRRHGLAWLYCLVALAAGGALGWYRGKMIAISIDPVTHILNQKMSPAAMLFIIALRIGARAMVVEMHAGSQILLLVTDLLIAFALGLLSAQRLEMAIRARRLLHAARTGIVVA
jgi:hypothetical protein